QGIGLFFLLRAVHALRRASAQERESSVGEELFRKVARREIVRQKSRFEDHAIHAQMRGYGSRLAPKGLRLGTKNLLGLLDSDGIVLLAASMGWFDRACELFAANEQPCASDLSRSSLASTGGSRVTHARKQSSR